MLQALVLARIRTFDPLRLLYYLGVFTVSFDIFLVLNLGFNFRFAQIAWGLPIAAATLLALLNRRLIRPVGFKALWLWFVCIVVFIPNAALLSRGIGYAFWLGYNVALILATCYLFKDLNKLRDLVGVYLTSFIGLSWFGLLQFAASLLRLQAPFVVQYWPHQIARINGFSYEPSYYASYLLLGWVLSAYLLKRKSPLFSQRFLQTAYYSTTLALILSSSRMGWIMMALWYLQYPLQFFSGLLQNRLNLPSFRKTLALSGILLLGLVTILYLVGWSKVAFLVAGLGIGGGPAHSSGTRTRELMDTLKVFSESPWVGYSLGGIASAIGHLRGVSVDSLEVAKNNEGMAIFAEALAASGLIGFIPFALYMLSLLFEPLKRAHQVEPPLAELLRGLVLALVFELAILQFNQNILRLYLWLHIAILSAAFAVAARYPAPTPSRPAGEPS